MKGFKNLSQILTLSGVHKKDGRGPVAEDLNIIEDGAVIYNDHTILWVGQTKDIPTKYQNISLRDGHGHVLTPEIVDSHTHLVFGGNRSKEYSMRLNGADYEAIAKAGGGILSTMKQTNEASRDELFSIAKKRIERIHSYGIGTIEIKSGYGLNIQKEIECAEIINDLKIEFKNNVQIFNTFMPAHAIPTGFANGREYLEKIVYPSIDQVHKKNIIDAVDIFFEEGYFNKEDTEQFFKFCQDLNLPLKVHADEFNDNGGASLACEYKALSCDHLLRTGSKGIESLSKSNTVATILPGTGFFLGKDQADARKLIDKGAKLSIASDFNPGSCHCDNLVLISSLAAPTLKLSLAEIWCGITLNAAHSLGLREQGAILQGLKPRFSLFKVGQVDEITYNWGRNFSVPV